MKWIGQNIYDQISKFRGADGSSVTIDSNSTEPLVIYQPVVDANPKILIGSSSTERLMIRPFYGSGTQTLQTVFFTTTTASGVANYGAFRFNVDATNILDIDDGGIDLDTGMGISINGTDILTDSSGTATLSNIDALDATTISTLNAALTAGDITGVTAGTGLSGGGTSGAVTLNVEASQALTSVVFDGNRSVTPRDGAKIHVDAATITDSGTSASGTATNNNTVAIESQTLAATNASVTNTHAASLYIGGAPNAGTNMTLTNAYALWVDNGLVKFDGALTVDGTITGDVTGDLTGEAATVATIAGLAPNTATTQATQNAITTLDGVTSIGATTMAITSAAVQQYKAANDGNPLYRVGSSDTNELLIQALYHSGAQTLETLAFRTETASGTADDGKFLFQVDALSTLQIDDGGIDFSANHGISIAGTDILTDSSGTATLSNIDALDATTETTIEAAIDTLSNLTAASSLATVGTITTGVWEGTAIATDQQKHLMHYEFMGFNNSTADTVYEYAETMNDTKAPLEHTADHNATITTAMVVGNYFKSGGQVMPRAGTIKSITGWAHTNGTAAEHKIALVRLRPVENDLGTISPVLVQETVWTSLGGNKLKLLDGAIVTAGSADDLLAGDILMTMIKDNTGGRQVYFNITVELEV